MKTLYDEWATDKKKEVEGIWVKEGDHEFLLARAGGANRMFVREFSRVVQKQQNKPKTEATDDSIPLEDDALLEGEMSEEEERWNTEAYARLFSKYIMKNWRTAILDEETLEHIGYEETMALPWEDEPVKYTPARGFRVLTELPELARRLDTAALDRVRYKPDFVAKSKKASARRSTGSSKGRRTTSKESGSPQPNASEA